MIRKTILVGDFTETMRGVVTFFIEWIAAAFLVEWVVACHSGTARGTLTPSVIVVVAVGCALVRDNSVDQRVENGLDDLKGIF